MVPRTGFYRLGWPAAASTQSVDGLDVGVDGDDGGLQADEQDVRGEPGGGGAQVSSGGVVSSLDRFLLLAADDNTKKVRNYITTVDLGRLRTAKMFH